MASSSNQLALWDVFLSFCGNDTRRNFTASLYFALDQAGFSTFGDDHALQKGQEISSGLLKAIKNSKMFVIVLSENSYAFEADVPNREIAEWFTYKSSGNTISFDIPPNLGDNFLGIALWAVYECKNSYRCSPFITLVIKNKREGIAGKFLYYVGNDRVGEVCSILQCKWREDIAMKSGDRTEVSFQKVVDHCGIFIQSLSKVVMMCGAHLIQKIP